MRIDPRLRVLYLAAIVVGVFFLRETWHVGALVVAHAVLWLLVGLPARRLVRQVVKLWGFALFIVASYAFADDSEPARWVQVTLLGFVVPVNVEGAIAGATAVLRGLAVVLASQIARAGDGRAIAAGLGKLGAPAIAASSIDAVLALFGDGAGRHGGGGGGGGRGGGGGGGGGRTGGAGEGDPPEGFFAALRRLGRGDVGGIARRIERQIDRAERHAIESGLPPGSPLARDVATIAGLSLTMLGIKALKVLPSIPFAPGHKLALLTPLYVIASRSTRSRFGATWTGLTMGTVAFLLGDGRYGVFEVLKHTTPGLICDLLLPWVAPPSRKLGPVAWSVLGGIIAAGRFATIFCVTLFVQAPAVAFAFLIPGATVHVVFGVLSGYITYQLVRSDPPRAHGDGATGHPSDKPATPREAT